MQVWFAPGRTKDFSPFTLHRTYTGQYDETVSIDWSSDSRYCTSPTANKVMLSSGGSSVSQNNTTAHSRIYSHFKIPSKQLHWLDFILLKFITYDIVIKLF